MSEMRFRGEGKGDEVAAAVAAVKPAPPSASKASGGSMFDRKEAARIEKMVSEMAGKSPPWLAKILKPAAPVIGYVVVVLEWLLPFVVVYFRFLYKVWSKLPTNVMGVVYGLALCFFGGFYPVSIAAFEAFSATGGQKVKMCVSDLMEDITAVMAANKEDDKKDDDGDGVVDVNQVDGKTLLMRKSALALKTVNPDRVTGALSGIYQGYMGILVVLKFQFARTVALAVSIGDAMRPLAAKGVGPVMAAVMPKDYHQWIAPIINYTCKFIAMSIAWWIQRVISTVQSAIKGGLMAARSLLQLLIEHEILNLNPDDTFMDEIIGWALAALGAWFQISMAWDLPFLVDCLFMPVSVSEWFLKWSVTWMEVDAVPPPP